MTSPFPGMDPYLEHPERWQGFHNVLIAALQLDLAPRVRPHYIVRADRRSYLSDPGELVLVGLPDITVHAREAHPWEQGGPAEPLESKAVAVQVPVPQEVREAFLEIRAVGSGEVVTVLELLSPTNKVPGRGRDTYLAKRGEVLASRTSLVEIDLSRTGQPMPIYGTEAKGYRILISRGSLRPRAELLTFTLRDRVPTFRLPLRTGDQEPFLDLRALVDDIYDRAGYDLEIDYREPPIPSLDEADAVWADDVLRRAGLRE